MNTYDILKCKCCGGTLKRSVYNMNEYVCEYCNTRYKSDSPGMEPIRIETFQNPVVTLQAKTFVDSRCIDEYGQENVSKMAINRLINNLAESLAEHVTIRTEYDPAMMHQIITARVRVVKNDYLF